MYVNWAQEEMNEAFHSNMPRTDDWIELDIQDKIHEVVSRMVSRVILGKAVSQNKEWADLSVQFTKDLFGTGFILKHFPNWLRPVVAPLIPNRWRLRQCVEKGKKIVGSQIKMRQDAIASNMPPEDTLLGWMLDNGTDVEIELTRITHMQLLLMLASIHITTMTAANFLFDLCTHVEWMPVLRKEIEDVIAEYGPVGSRPDIPARVWLSKLEKMDSFLVESQRLEPATQLKPMRAVLQDVTLKDGTRLPRGTLIAWTGHQHVHDPAVNPDPYVFDPMRSYRKRYANDKAEYNKYVAGQNELTNLAFGYGNQACPGRYFAVNEIKLMLSRLVMECEWKLPNGTTRPQSYGIEENYFLQPHCKIMMRSRKVE
ncbi:hypothetical protein PTNB85_03757 [Pyrenophora teres f. teres]|nr:hypothetical protein HRS9139_05689 [Pyrenophora teres f. teres]KAE8840358.1 hypothetical protein PTNB85_03757 [Pyrenophora teres f. teres]KAE8863857.1 hypothetical protein PTNB29_03821 [Pyrenophora teres f. teres]CAE7033980.1 CypX [Pyrenophora teres f. teres]